MTDKRQERRFKLLRICETHILDWLNFKRETANSVFLPVPGQLPADAICEAVHYDPTYRSFLVRVWSSEFEIVPDGEWIPEIEPPMFEVSSLREFKLVPVHPEPSHALRYEGLSEDGKSLVFKNDWLSWPESYDGAKAVAFVQEMTEKILANGGRGIAADHNWPTSREELEQNQQRAEEQKQQATISEQDEMADFFFRNSDPG